MGKSLHTVRMTSSTISIFSETECSILAVRTSISGSSPDEVGKLADPEPSDRLT